MCILAITLFGSEFTVLFFRRYVFYCFVFRNKIVADIDYCISPCFRKSWGTPPKPPLKPCEHTTATTSNHKHLRPHANTLEHLRPPLKHLWTLANTADHSLRSPRQSSVQILILHSAKHLPTHLLPNLTTNLSVHCSSPYTSLATLSSSSYPEKSLKSWQP